MVVNTGTGRVTFQPCTIVHVKFYVDLSLIRTMFIKIRVLRLKCFLQLRNLYQARNHVNANCLCMLVHSFVLTHMDYCNSLFASCKLKSLKKLQRVLYSAARLIKRLPRYHRDMSSVLTDLHWLSTKARIQMKLCCLMHRIVFGSAPVYLQRLVEPVPSIRYSVALRSRQGVLFRRSIFRSSLARSSFASAAPRAWNALPSHLRLQADFKLFKRQLKNYLL